MTAQGAGVEDPSRTAIHVRSGQIVLIEDSQGIGTGILVGADGFVLTNKHVAPGLGPYRVLLADGKDVRGVGVHQSPHHDLAIVKIAAAPASFLDVGSDVAGEYVVGEEVFALGHPRGCRFSVSRGIISNPHREMEKEYYVQTDVSINPGNSGGPLVDRQGNLVGIVTMMLSNSQGLGFAVPGHIAADYVRHVRRLLRAGVVKIPEELLTHADVQRESAPEVVRRAVGALVMAGRGAIEEEKASEGTYKIKHKNAVIEVAVHDGLFTARTQVASLGPAERQNAAFLIKLLELSASQDVGGVTFVIRDGALCVMLSRRAAGLDLEEATWAIDLVAQMGTEAPPKITSLLFGTGLTTGVPAQTPAGPPPQPTQPYGAAPGPYMMPGQPMPGQGMAPMMPGQPMPGQGMAPMMPGQPMPGQGMAPMMPGQPMPGQGMAPMMPGQPMPGQGMAPMMPGQPMPGQGMMPGQPMPGQGMTPMMPGQPMPGQGMAPMMPGQPMPGQGMAPMMPGQPMPGQGMAPMMPGQGMMPGQMMPGQGMMPGQPMPGQPMPGQPMPGQAPPAPGAPPAAPGATPADPGYPILQIPPTSGWK